MVGDYLSITKDFLAAKGVDNPRLDAEIMLAAVLGISRLELYTGFDRPLAVPEIDRFRDMVRRRAAREPVHYITGIREFWSLDFAVDRRVLIPRRETELLVELALERLSKENGSAVVGNGHQRLADIGTGAGAIAVALASEIEELRVTATDKSQSVLELAPLNARTHGVGGRIEFVCGDLYEALGGRDPQDMIVSNPPYVSESELGALEPEVREWEPRSALMAGEDGMAVAGPLIAGAPLHLKPGGWLLVEVGRQWRCVLECFEQDGWIDVCVHRDLAGIERVVAGRRPGRG
ncbi:MAG: peptide chain release factor N(5)-glutamine methyltransferase [Candidatus Binatia bacterium]